VTNSGGGQVVWTAAPDKAWLVVEPLNGTAPTEVTVSAVPGELAVGTYTGTVTFGAGGALGSPQALVVTLRVKEPTASTRGFTRGDSNMDRALNIGDPIHALSYLFGGQAVPCLDAVDANDDGKTDIADAIYTLTHLFASGPAPRAPFPGCGTDPTADALSCAAPRQCE
jgi:hypothetical protein